jgi:hypothetical protein
MQKRKIDGLSLFDLPSRVTVRHAVATGHAPRDRGSESHPDLLILPTVSGDECALALERCGLVRCDERAGVVWMEVGTAFVCVPRCARLPAETLAEILCTSGLSTREFVRELDTWQPPSVRMN